jgi:hypothetical protein
LVSSFRSLYSLYYIYILHTEVKKELAALKLLLTFGTWATASTTAPLPRKREYSFENIFAMNAFSFHCFSFKQNVFFFSFLETVIFDVSQVLFKLVGTTSGWNRWISGRRRTFYVMMLTPNLVLLGEISLILPGLLRRPCLSLRDDSKVRKGWEGARSVVKRSL